jgi:DNA-binding response OmpR family regulator
MVVGFRAGADDYMNKPFRVDELIIGWPPGPRSHGNAQGVLNCGPLRWRRPQASFPLTVFRCR